MTQQSSQTPAEQLRAAKQRAVIKEYRSIEASKEMIEKRDSTTLTPHRIMSMCADKYKMTVPGVRVILIKAGVYQPK